MLGGCVWLRARGPGPRATWGLSPGFGCWVSMRVLRGAGPQTLVGVSEPWLAWRVGGGLQAGAAGGTTLEGRRAWPMWSLSQGASLMCRGVGLSPCGEQAGTVLGSRYTFHWKNSPILNIGSEVLKNCTYIQFPDERSPSELGCSCRACRGRAPGPAAATGWGRGGPAEGQADSAGLLLWGSLAEGPGRTQGPSPESGNRRLRQVAISLSCWAMANCTPELLTPARDSMSCVCSTLGCRWTHGPDRALQLEGNWKVQTQASGLQGPKVVAGSGAVSPGVTAACVEGTGCAWV